MLQLGNAGRRWNGTGVTSEISESNCTGFLTRSSLLLVSLSAFGNLAACRQWEGKGKEGRCLPLEVIGLSESQNQLHGGVLPWGFQVPPERQILFLPNHACEYNLDNVQNVSLTENRGTNGYWDNQLTPQKIQLIFHIKIFR